MVTYVESADPSLLQVGSPQDTEAQTTGDCNPFELFLLELFRDVAKARKKIPLCDLQRELVRRRWHI